jgi:hypothetical protein
MGDKLPDYVFYKNHQINIAKILDNSFHYMKPLNKLSIEDGFQGAYVEEQGISLTIPGNKLSRLLHVKYLDYMSYVNKFKLPDEKIQKMIQGIINNYNVQYYNHIKLTYPADEYPPELFIHKLRRDLSTYYKNLGYSAIVKSKDNSEIEKSCDFYFDRNVETLPGKKKPVILKIYFIPDNLPFKLNLSSQSTEKMDRDSSKQSSPPKVEEESKSHQESYIPPENQPMSFEKQKEIILKQWEQNQVGGLFSNILSVGVEGSDTVSRLLSVDNNYKATRGESFIDYIRNNTQGETSSE